MKIKYILLLIISVFIINISNVNAAATVVADSDQSTLCKYEGASINLFTAIPLVPSTIPIVYADSGTLTISASKSSDEFIATVKVRYLDRDRLITIIDVDDLIQFGTKLLSGKLSFTDIVDFAKNVNGSDSDTTKAYIKNNFTVVSTVSNDSSELTNKVANDPYITKVLGTSSAVQQGSIAQQGAMATNGYCPDVSKVDVEYNALTKSWKISSITFDRDSLARTSFDSFMENYYKTLLNINIDKTIVLAGLSKYRFDDNAKYKSFNATTCLSESDANYYINQFNIIKNYAGNKSYVAMFKNNGFSSIAKSIVSTYVPGGACDKQNPSLASLYKKLQTSAQDALNIMNSTKDSVPKSECEYILGDPNKQGDFAYYLDITFRFIKFAAPILLICVSIFDYIKVIASGDADSINKTNKKTLIRLIFTLLLFFLPIIISFLLTLLGAQGSCGI